MKRNHLDPSVNPMTRFQRDPQLSVGTAAYGREMTPPLVHSPMGCPVMQQTPYYGSTATMYRDNYTVPRYLPPSHSSNIINPEGFLRAPVVDRCPLPHDLRNQFIMRWENEGNQYPKPRAGRPIQGSPSPVKSIEDKAISPKDGETNGIKRIWPSMGFGKLDIRETADNFIVCLDIPGVQKDSIDVSLKPNNIVVECVRNPVPQAKNLFHYIERPSGKLVRTIQLSSKIDPDSISCVYLDGVLKITLGKLREDNVIKKLRVE